ncbi:MAG: MarR family transcriptional regulator [Leptospirales bacterium]
MEASEKKVYDAIKAAKEPVKSAQVADATGIDKKDIAKIIKKLKTDGKVISPKNCYYSAN